MRKALEMGARKLKQGPLVREGLVVTESEFIWDTERYGETAEEISKTAIFSVAVVVQRSRLLRTRAKFDTPWSVRFVVDTDPELVDQAMLERWLDIAGRRLGMGDWRPEKSGQYGRYLVKSIEEVK